MRAQVARDRKCGRGEGEEEGKARTRSNQSAIDGREKKRNDSASSFFRSWPFPSPLVHLLRVVGELSFVSFAPKGTPTPEEVLVGGGKRER